MRIGRADFLLLLLLDPRLMRIFLGCFDPRLADEDFEDTRRIRMRARRLFWLREIATPRLFFMSRDYALLTIVAGRERTFSCPARAGPKNLTVPLGPPSILNVGINQHRWKNWVSDEARIVLEELTSRLKWAWEADQDYPKSYPLNTDKAFSVIRAKLELRRRHRSGIQRRIQKLPRQTLPRKRLSKLLNEKTIKAVYENQNDGRYEDALKLAAAGEGKGFAAWRKIWHAINDAYLIHVYGDEFIPKPRVQFLHRNLLELADVVEMHDVKDEGVAEFFDDLCPCGKRHESEAIRKLRTRWARRKGAKP